MDNLVETIKMTLQDALSHRGWGPMSRVRRRYTQSCRATNPRPHVRIILIRRKARGSGRCHGRRGRSGRYLGRRRRIVGGALVKGRIEASAEGEATENTCTTRMLLFDHRWRNNGGNPLRGGSGITGPTCGSTTLVEGGVTNFYLLALFIFEDRGRAKSGRAPVWERGTGFRGAAHKVGKERRAGR
jgi:hypothetical protein